MIILFATHVVSDVECIAREVLLLKNGVLQKKYIVGNVSQRINGLMLRIVGDELPA